MRWWWPSHFRLWCNHETYFLHLFIFHSKCWFGFQWQYKVEVHSSWIFYCRVLMLLIPLQNSSSLCITVCHCRWGESFNGKRGPAWSTHLTHSTDVHIPADVCRIPKGSRVFFMTLSWWNQGKHKMNMMRDVLSEWKAQADTWKDWRSSIFLDVRSAIGSGGSASFTVDRLEQN